MAASCKLHKQTWVKSIQLLREDNGIDVDRYGQQSDFQNSPV
jgi:hypothetical protein